MSKTAVVVGGAFNPITTAHLMMGYKAKELFPDADILFVPSGINFQKSWKNVDSTFLKDRDKILYDVFRNRPEFTLLDIKGKTDLAAIDTVDYLKSIGYTNIYLCIGADKINEVSAWKDSERLVQTVRFLIYTRTGYEIENILPHSTIIDTPPEYNGISSTKVRECIKQNKSIKQMVPIEVYNFYRKER